MGEKYASSEQWTDVVPILQDDSGSHALANIAYTDDYSEAMAYFRAVVASGEKSQRVLQLTEDIINMNPAHYTIWIYRAATIFAIDSDLHAELNWLEELSFTHLKNYQIWNHRQTIIGRLPTVPAPELDFLEEMLSMDAKNYHVWSYRQWLVRHFALWDHELAYVEKLLDEDVRNNSAWNHRWFVVFGRHLDPEMQSFNDPSLKDKIDSQVFDRELDFTKSKISLAPQNASPWNYLKAVLKIKDGGFLAAKPFAESFIDLHKTDAVRSSFALDLLAEIYAQEQDKDKAGRALEMLGTIFDPIRRNYWNYRRSLLGLPQIHV